MAHQSLSSYCSAASAAADLQAKEIKKPSKIAAAAARQTAGFHPSVWGDHFLAYHEDHQKVDAWSRKVEELKEEVKGILIKTKGSSLQVMNLFNEVQRLGLAHHFEKEIDEALLGIYDAYSKVDYDDLHVVALRFRLLRQAGYHVSADVFNQFKDEDGHFSATVSSDARGMLSLYEAAYLCLLGEDILDEAIVFARKHLKSALDDHLLEYPLSALVQRALELPLHKRLNRLEARFYIKIYQEDRQSRNDLLLELAIFDFNLLQLQHKGELKELSRWWKDLGLAIKYPFARDRLVEGYFWILGVYFEPQYARARAIFTRIFKLISVIDDIYDVYGMLEELEVFNDAVHRWELEAADGLPDYMKACYVALLKTVDEIEDWMMPGEKFYRTDFIKKQVTLMVQAHFDEAKWRDTKFVPTLEEHLKVSLISCGYPLLTGVAYVGMGDVASKEVFHWLSSHPKFIMNLCMICRLVDDIAGHQFEQERNHVASTVESYIREHGVSEEEASNKLREMVTGAWKDINTACLRPTAIPSSLLQLGSNLVRVIEVLYLQKDGYTHSKHDTKEKIISVLVDPVPIPLPK